MYSTSKSARVRSQPPSLTPSHSRITCHINFTPYLPKITHNTFSPPTQQSSTEYLIPDSKVRQCVDGRMNGRAEVRIRRSIRNRCATKRRTVSKQLVREKLPQQDKVVIRRLTRISNRQIIRTVVDGTSWLHVSSIPHQRGPSTE